MSTSSTGRGLAEVIPIRPDQDSSSGSIDPDAERLAELDAKIREHFDQLHELIMERIEIERGEAA